MFTWGNSEGLVPDSVPIGEAPNTLFASYSSSLDFQTEYSRTWNKDHKIDFAVRLCAGLFKIE